MNSKTAEWRPGPSVCRCCLSEGCYKDISTEYFWMGKREVYAEMLADTFDLTIAYSKSKGPNSNSRLICEPCISRLRDATDFKRQVQECERTFLQHLDPEGSSDLTTLEVTAEPLSKLVKLEDGEEIKEENLASDFDDADDIPDFGDDDDDDDLDDQPLTTLASKTPKKESMDFTDLLDNAKAEKRKSSSKAKASPAKKVKTKKEKVVAKPKPEKKKKGGDAALVKAPTERVVPLFQVAYDRSLCRPLGTVLNFARLGLRVKRSGHYNVADYIPPESPRSASPLSHEHRSPTPPKNIPIQPLVQVPRHVKAKKQADYRQNALTVFEFSNAYPFIYCNNKFKCFICSQQFLETSLLRVHMNENHTFAPLKRLLNNRRETVLKVDVSELVCKICSVAPKDLLQLKFHLKEEHGKLIDPNLQDNMIPFNLDIVGGAYKCVMCEETFIKVRILVIHMSVHFNNYSCEICGSGFMTLRLLKKHLEVHETGNFPCDRCNKVFSTAQKRSLHIRGVHLKQYPRRCPMCPERFNSNYRRTIHLQDVHNQSTRVHKCETCGRGFNLKYHLICHTRSVHLQERNEQCKVCLHRFSNKETLKRHMIIHTGEKNYKCEMCGLAFLRRKNLKDHLRLHDVV